MKNLITIFFVALFFSAHAQIDFYDTNRFGNIGNLEPFFHGVASGDPTSSSVMIWTRVTTEEASADVSWYVATDTAMTNIVAEGTVTTDASKDFTIKVDVTGLQPYTTYYYDFLHEETHSLRGRTRTAPAGGVDALRFGVVSCSNFAHGFFNVYEKLVDRNDIDAIIHLGDYIYEYGNGEYGDVREYEPSTEILNLSDYRMRHSYYKLDDQLRRLHQQYPVIATWDDHESANDSWKDGAENHNTGEGDWATRKSVAIQAYNEWMPFRKPDATDQERIYRKVSYGDMMDLFMLDTRLYGREEQGQNENDPERTILGQTQYDWLTSGLGNSTAKWQVLGQQVMMGPLVVFGNPLNGDQWDGYPAERDKLHNYAIDNNIPNLVVLTGDIHTSWAMDLPMDNYDSGSGANSAGVEFVVTSVTSPSFIDFPGLENFVLPFNPHIKWANLVERGYYILNLTDTRCQADWYYIDNVDSNSANESYGQSWYTDDGTRHLNNIGEPTVAAPNTITEYAPEDPRAYTPPSSSGDLNELAFIGVHPNPVADNIYLQFINYAAHDMSLSIFDVSGKEVFQENLGHRSAGLQKKTINVSSLPAGTYYIQLKTERGSYKKTIIKVK